MAHAMALAQEGMKNADVGGMRVTDSSVAMQSHYMAVEKLDVRETLRVWKGNTRPDFSSLEKALGPSPSSVVSISDQARAARLTESEEITQQNDVAENDPRTQMIMRMVESLTGQKIRLLHVDMSLDKRTQKNLEDIKPLGQKSGEPTSAGQRADAGLAFDAHTSYYEAEQSTFAAQGVVKTADGQEINFSLDLSMSREYFEQSDVSVRAGQANMKDPLVVNFGGNAAQLADARFGFDIDSDGIKDKIPFLKPGSGFLAFDKNDNGRIDNGKELFGAASGNGFADLAKLDADGNRWIDQNDPAFAKLLVWTPDANATDSLKSLGEFGIGALHLGAQQTPFSIKNADDVLQALIRATGVFLNEDGTAGTLQQVDMSA